jgi:SAM-dependent methyltransferase
VNLKSLQRNWQNLGRIDPLWSILTDPARQGGLWDEEQFYETGVREVEALMSRLDELGLPSERRRALDFGCGAGRITIPLAGHFGETVGVDIAPAMVEFASKRNRQDNCHFLLNVRGDLSIIEDRSFDFVYSRLVLQHVPPPYVRRYIREFVRVTRPGGAIMFQLPTPSVDRAPGGGRGNRVPMPLLRLARRCRRGLRHIARGRSGATIDDYGLDRDETLSILADSGAVVSEVILDHSHGTDRPGYEYWALLPSRPRR